MVVWAPAETVIKPDSHKGPPPSSESLQRRGSFSFEDAEVEDKHPRLVKVEGRFNDAIDQNIEFQSPSCCSKAELHVHRRPLNAFR